MTAFTATRDEATAAILGAILLAPDPALDIATSERIRPAHFPMARDRALYQAMLDLADNEQQIDTITLAAKAEQHWPNHEIDVRAAIELYAGGTPFLGNLRDYCRIVRDHAWFDDAARACMLAADAAGQHNRQGVLSALANVDTASSPDEPARDAASEFLDWYESETKGIPLPFPVLTEAVGGGLQAGEVSILGGWPGMGKALAIDTPVPTPDGWRTMGSIEDGDRVFGANGMPVNVLKAWPVRVDRECYRVTFNDGSTIVADAEHLWHVYTRAARRSEVAALSRAGQPLKVYGTDQSHKRAMPEVITTAELAASIGGSTRHSVPTSAPIQHPTADLPMDPYLLGLWLGDGTTIYPVITVGDEDRDHVIEQLEQAGQRVTVRQGRTAWSVRFLGGLDLLRAAGVLGDKHIPPSYLTASAEQRLALLQGLVDSDGTVAPGGRCEITVTKPRLAEDILDLALSLGLRAVKHERPAKIAGRIVGSQHRIGFCTDMPVCRLPRKAARLPKRVGSRSTHRYIVAVDRVDSVPVRCITVDAPDSLYLVGRAYIPTHNTFFAKDIMLGTRDLGAVCHEYANEMSGPRLTARLLSSMCGISAPRIRNRQLNADEWKQVLEILKHPPYETTPSAGWTPEDYCRDLRKRRPDLAVIDTVTNLPCSKVDEWDRACGMLADTAAQTGTHLILLSQLNKERDTGQIKPPPTGRDLRNTGAWYMRARVVMFVHRDQEIVESTGIVRALSDGHIRVEKATHGEPEIGYVAVTFNPKWLRFDDLNSYRAPLEVVA